MKYQYLMVEADYSHSNAEVNNACNCISAYVFMVWCVIRRGVGGYRESTCTNTLFIGLICKEVG